MMDEEIRQALSEVREMKQMCGHINMKLTNIVTQRGQNWKAKLEAEYQRGLDDAWEAARKIFGYEIDGGIPIDKIGSVFGYSKDAIFCTADIFRHNNASEAIEKLKAYEEQKADGEIKVGDIVDWDGDKYIVSYINDDGCADLIYIKCGSTCERVSPDCFTRTGKHFDIDKILEEMKLKQCLLETCLQDYL